MTERGAALLALSPDQKKRLQVLSRALSQGTGDEGGDLIQAAQVRWLKTSSCDDLTPDAVCKFLAEAMYSIRSNRFRQLRGQQRQLGNRLVPAVGDDEAEEPVECVEDRTQSAEDYAFAQQIYDRCKDDPEIQSYIMYRLERSSRTQMQEDAGWADNKYEAIQKRFNRMVAKWKIEGLLP
jgi:hypothetical protein